MSKLLTLQGLNGLLDCDFKWMFREGLLAATKLGLCKVYQVKKGLDKRVKFSRSMFCSTCSSFKSFMLPPKTVGCVLVVSGSDEARGRMAREKLCVLCVCSGHTLPVQQLSYGLFSFMPYNHLCVAVTSFLLNYYLHSVLFLSKD